MRRLTPKIIVVLAALLMAPAIVVEQAAAAPALPPLNPRLLPTGSALLTLSANALNQRATIKIGDLAPFTNAGPAGTIQVLTLDRSTLKPYRLGNSWCCDSGAHSLANLSTAITNLGFNQLVVLVLPAQRAPGVLTSSKYKDFNKALGLLGVGPLDDKTFLDPLPDQQVVIVGIPHGAPGSGWAWRYRKSNVFPQVDPFPVQGWLMPDGTTGPTGALNMRFQPVAIPFETRASSPANGNTMVVGGKSPTASIPAGNSGFHVVAMDPFDMSVLSSSAFATNGPEDDLPNLANSLKAARQTGQFVAVQSIGNPGNHTGAVYERPDEWGAVDVELKALGADPQLFTTLDTNDHASYAFLGGPPYNRADVVVSNSTIVVDPTTNPPTNEPGSLHGHLRMRPDGGFSPVLRGPSIGITDNLYDMVLRPSTPWPLTSGSGDPNAVAYDKAMAYLTSRIPSLQTFVPNLRRAYVQTADNNTVNWSAAKTSLDAVKYPGAKSPCPPSGSPGPIFAPLGVGFTPTQFCALVNQLRQEFTWLNSVSTAFSLYKQAFSTSVGGTQVDLTQIGMAIENGVKPPSTSITSSILKLVQNVAAIGTAIFGGGALTLALGLVRSAFDLGSALVVSGGQALSAEIATTVDLFAREVNATAGLSAAALDQIHLVANADYGRLRALGTSLGSAGLVDAAQLAVPLTRAATRYYTEQLMPLGIGVTELTSLDGDPLKDCWRGGYTYEDVPDSGWMFFHHTIRTIQTLVMTKRDRYTEPPDPFPTAVTDAMFIAPIQGGDGLVKSTWFWQQGDPQSVGCIPIPNPSP